MHIKMIRICISFACVLMGLVVFRMNYNTTDKYRDAVRQCMCKEPNIVAEVVSKYETKMEDLRKIGIFLIFFGIVLGITAGM